MLLNGTPNNNDSTPSPIASLLLAITLSVPLLAMADPSDGGNWWTKAKDKATTIIDQGTSDLYLSGYAHHGRHTYSAERIHELNEKSWGLGYGRSLRDGKDNLETMYVLGISDSHYKPQLMAGYAHQWMRPVASSGIELGAGYTAMLMSRQDYFGGVPFPIVLPLASIGSRQDKLMFSYVPRLSGNKGNGDVLYVFGRIELK